MKTENTTTTKNDPQKVLLPSIELPKGGGAIQQIGEKFSVNTASGTGTYSIPISVSPGRLGFQPSLSLGYDSGAGNSPFGLGWDMPVSSISRNTSKGLPTYSDGDERDVFMLSGAEDLVPLLEEENDWQPRIEQAVGHTLQYYRPRTEGAYSRIVRHTPNEHPAQSFWKVTTRDNVTHIYGRQHRVVNPEHASQVFEWLLEESHDNLGNIIQYNYLQENTEGIDPTAPSEQHRLRNDHSFARLYLKSISYGNQVPHVADDWHFNLVLDYGDHDTGLPGIAPSQPWPVRHDPFSSYRAGFELRTYRLCQRVLLFHTFPALNDGVPTLVRSTELEYRVSKVASLLIRARQTGYIKTEAGYDSKSTPAVSFTYSEPIVGQTIRNIDPQNLVNTPTGLGERYQFVDLEGEGLSGILSEQGGAWHYKANLGNGAFAPTRRLHQQPSLSTGQPSLQDVDGDGNKELVVMDEEVNGYYTYRDSEWGSFMPFREMPNHAPNDPNLRHIDLNGDGFADLLVSEDEVMRWFPSKAKGGYASSRSVRKPMDEQDGPALVFSNRTESIFLADMSGDGLTDLVRIRNHEVAYWPNLGYGRFGAKIVMDHSPTFDAPEDFNRQHLRLADIDGSGTTDMLYFNDEGARFWINQAGNGWSEARSLTQFPGVTTGTHVEVADILGTGTACLVWSSSLPEHQQRPMKYIDLMEPAEDKPLGKPYLLIGADNGMGKTESWRYAPSTKFYLEDRKAGRPWVTKLHFPVYVVDQAEVVDQISKTKRVNTYRYHHGYFDPLEREFRGFGMVEQLDSETYETFLEQQPDTEQEAHFQPPILTKTWFHTGAYLNAKQLSRHYEREYFQGEETDLLPDSVIEVLEDETFDVYREASRALRGMTLRQEVYALDNTGKNHLPYSVTGANYAVRQVQPKRGQRHAVFMTTARENLSLNYERNTEDPRISHEFTLETDQYGTVLKAAQVHYARRTENQPDAHPEQYKKRVIMSETNVVHHDHEPDHYLLGIPVEEKGYEVTGMAEPEGLFHFHELKTAVAAAETIPFHETPGETAQARLLAQTRHYFWHTDLESALDHGETTWPLLTHHSERAVFTPELLTQAFDDRLNDEDLETRGGYRFSDGYWWAPTPITHYRYHDQPGADDVRNRENRFLQPVEVEQPLESDATQRMRVFYDAHELIAVSTEDPEGLTQHAEIDYRTLTPKRMTDANENVFEVRCDPLGMAIVSTAYGSEEGDNGEVWVNGDLALADYNTQQPATLEEVLADPHRFLQGASSFFFYDLEAWSASQQPSQFISVTRETHARTLEDISETRLQIAMGYSDGFGRALQQNVLVEAGRAYQVSEAGGLILDPETHEPRQEEAAQRWLCSGRTVYNNKQKPVKQYEPFYINSPAYLPEEHTTRIGITPLIHYDPMERVIRTDTPKGFYSKVEFTPWSASQYDLNDTVSEYFDAVERGETQVSPEERAGLEKAMGHANTPVKQILDVLGQTVQSIGMDENGAQYITETQFNSTGQPLTHCDPRQYALNLDRAEPLFNFLHAYDMAGNLLRTKSLDAGVSHAFNNVLGNPVFTWNARGFKSIMTYDHLQRPTSIWVEGDDLPEAAMVVQMLYAAPGIAAAKNLRGQLLKTYDQSGVTEVACHGFKGEMLRSHRQFTNVMHENGTLRNDLGELLNWNVSHDDRLEEEVFTSSQIVDAMGRIVTQTTPDGSVHQPVFNQQGQLTEVRVQHRGSGAFKSFVQSIRYNEKGQRRAIRYGNEVTSHYAYEPKTYRLSSQRTIRPGDNNPLQDLHYWYDPVGNITQIRDEARDDIYFQNAEVRAERTYTYDAFYQLQEATGREHIGQTGLNPVMDQINVRHPIPHRGDATAMRHYIRRYSYDAAGNMQSLQHRAGTGANEYRSTRHFEYDTDSNRLLRSGVGQDANRQRFTYDAAGNTLELAHVQAMHWDHTNSLRQIDRNGLTAWYHYDISGNRTRKIVRRGANEVQVRYYLDGTELFREYHNGRLKTERETVHVMDDQQRIAMIDTQTIRENTRLEEEAIRPLHRYQLSDHLGSSSIELDDEAQVISYEEYYPYGSTSYQSASSNLEVPRKRYRYTGMERDEESGLNYHGARYYAPWLCRWLKPDPAGTVDGLNVYRYVKNDPIMLIDPNGNKAKKPPKHKGFLVHKQSKLSAEQFVTAIKSNKTLPLYIREGFSHGPDPRGLGRVYFLRKGHGKHNKEFSQEGIKAYQEETPFRQQWVDQLWSASQDGAFVITTGEIKFETRAMLREGKQKHFLDIHVGGKLTPGREMTIYEGLAIENRGHYTVKDEAKVAWEVMTKDSQGELKKVAPILGLTFLSENHLGGYYPNLSDEARKEKVDQFLHVHGSIGLVVVSINKGPHPNQKISSDDIGRILLHELAAHVGLLYSDVSSFYDFIHHDELKKIKPKAKAPTATDKVGRDLERLFSPQAK